LHGTLTDSTSHDSEFDEAVKEYVYNYLRRFVEPGEKAGALLMAMLRRALRQASHEVLQDVFRETSEFVDDLRARGFFVSGDEIADEASGYLSEVSGPGAPYRDDEGGEIDSGETPDRDVSEGDDGASGEDDPQLSESSEGDVAPAEGPDSGHETPMAGDEDSDREESTESLQENGAG
jgi:hypothetical protein